MGITGDIALVLQPATINFFFLSRQRASSCLTETSKGLFCMGLAIRSSVHFTMVFPKPPKWARNPVGTSGPYQQDHVRIGPGNHMMNKTMEPTAKTCINSSRGLPLVLLSSCTTRWAVNSCSTLLEFLKSIEMEPKTIKSRPSLSVTNTFWIV